MRKLRGRVWKRPFFVVVGLLAGCESSPPASTKSPAQSFRGLILKVGALDDGAIVPGVVPLRGEWIASRQGEISVAEEPATLETVSAFDILLFRAERLGDLVDKGALAPIPNEVVLPPRPVDSETEDQGRQEKSAAAEADADSFHYMDIAPAYRDQVTRYGSERLALPCGGSALILAYRRDAFENKDTIEAARQAGIALKPPATWTQLDALAKFFQGRDWNGEPGPDHGIALALGPDTEGVAEAILLARAASVGQHRDHYSFLFDSDVMSARVDSPPFVQALEDLVALGAFGPPGKERFDAQAARAAFRSGKVAMLIDRAEQASAWSQGKPIGVAALPGSERVYEPLMKVWQACSPLNTPSYLPRGGGWLVGINAALSGMKLDAARDFARYLASPENANRLRAEPTFPMLPVRISQISQGLPDPTAAPDVDSRQWSQAVGQTLLAERVVPGLRIPDAEGYLADLSKARQAALAGKPAQEALQGLAQAWSKRTLERGLKRQLWHYRRSLNSLATLPRPPDPGK
jgi:multiple sugar transport system substrate-binding protein